MFCPSCGTQLSTDARFCKSCGAAVSITAPRAALGSGAEAAVAPPSPQAPQYAYTLPVATPPASLIGFSPRIGDPAFAKYQKNAKRWALLFSGILFVIASVGFPIYGSASKDIDFPQSLYYGMGIGGMFVIIALIQTLRAGRDSTWDGTIVDRSAVRKTQSDNDGQGHRHYTEYMIRVRCDNGRIKTHRMIDLPGLYDYYRVGERVRHHKGFSYYEKYDKSQDAVIMCMACMHMNSVLLDRCERCGCPVLKV